MKKKFIFIFSIIISCIFSSCGPKLFFSEAKEIDSKGWAKDSLLRFNVEVTDTVSEYSFLISVRNTDEYPAQNFWLFMDIIDPSGKVEKDTVECYLANNKGRNTYFFLPLLLGLVGLFSALRQGKICANGITAIGNGHDVIGKTVVLAAFPELYAILAVAAVFMISSSI